MKRNSLFAVLRQKSNNSSSSSLNKTANLDQLLAIPQFQQQKDIDNANAVSKKSALKKKEEEEEEVQLPSPSSNNKAGVPSLERDEEDVNEKPEADDEDGPDDPLDKTILPAGAIIVPVEEKYPEEKLQLQQEVGSRIKRPSVFKNPRKSMTLSGKKSPEKFLRDQIKAKSPRRMTITALPKNVGLRMFGKKVEDAEIPVHHCSGPTAEKLEFKWVYKQAMRGNVQEMFTLAYHYDTGATHVTINTEEAIHWYHEAALKGHVIAMNNLGVLYATGHRGRIQKDEEEAAEWYEMAAASGYAPAQFHLGLMYMSGTGVSEKNPAEAFKWFKLAAKQGHLLSLSNVGAMYMNGQGVARDYQKSLKWLRKAVAKGSSVAMHNLGVMYYKGYGVKVNESKGLKYIDLAISRNTKDPVPRDLSDGILEAGEVLMNL